MAEDRLRDMLAQALAAAQADGDLPPCQPALQMSRPPDPELGDFSSNLPMALGSRLGRPPRQVAELLLARLPETELVERIEIAGPGFINFHLSPLWMHQALRECLLTDHAYGTSDGGAGKRVQVEFISANPVGPLHVGNARAGPYGDALANLLAATGHQVEREYLVNDGPDNTQFRLFGASVQARVREQLGLDFGMPEDGYQGDYVGEFAARLIEQHGDGLGEVPADDEGAYQFAIMAGDLVLDNIRADCDRLGIEFDVWFSERALFEQGKVQRKLDDLRRRGVVYDSDGATWLATARFGDEEDRVLVRGTGATTYLMTDLAYAEDKFERGFDLAIYVWGPDHRAQMGFVRSGLAAMGADPDRTEFIIHQIVRLIEGGQVVRMSKRAGQIVTVGDLLDEVGRDVARFFLLSRSIDSHLDFDLDLARKESDENPVYYVQYAHARICSIQREAEGRGFQLAGLPEADLSLLTHPDEARLLRAIADYPGEVSSAAAARAPHRLTHFVRELAAIFHQFYGTCRVLDEAEPDLSAARLALVRGTQIVLRNLLGILGVSAPERM
jgi:arginyl-tRNA synthetase